jgi:hypothetical protein
MSKQVSEIKPAEIYSDLSREDIAEMMAEATKVDALFQSGRISTMYPTALSTSVQTDDDALSNLPATAA